MLSLPSRDKTIKAPYTTLPAYLTLEEGFHSGLSYRVSVGTPPIGRICDLQVDSFCSQLTPS